MCGIAGILSTKPNDAMAAPLAAMQKCLRHRGPDGHGDYFSPSRHAALAHTRLSIIDLTERGQQPMSVSNGRYTISYNGEIYNYQQLRKRLENEGVSFNSESDTEVILRLYESKGSQCVHFLRGMFAFVIWDEKKKKAFAARDPLGIKPFYYLKNSRHCAFASEIRALLASDLSYAKISGRGLAGYFQRGTAQEPDTLIRDIKMLPAGSTLTWQGGKTRLKSYWRIKFKPQRLRQKQAVEVTRAALEDSVRAHFVSDVPVGIFLSGGIDSTALVALAKKVTNKPINTYSIAFNNPEWNEGDIAKRVADHFGTNHTELLMTPMDALPLFYDYLKAIDQPSIDGFNTYCVSKLASEKGEKVVLSGLGADELFAGYKSFTLIPEMLEKSARFKPVSGLLNTTNKFLQYLLPTKQRRILDALSVPDSIATAHKSLRGIFSDSEAVALASKFTGKKVQPPSLSEPDTRFQSDQISVLEIEKYMRNQLLRDSDVCSMAWGLELRVPFVDKVLVDRLSSIPAELRLQQGKRLLIEAIPELPSWVIERPKQGFRFPFDEWFSDEWSDMAIEPAPKWIPLSPWYRRWSLTVFSDWKRRYAR